MKTVLIIFMYFNGSGSSEQIEFPDPESCAAAIDQLPERDFHNMLSTRGFCVELAE